LFLKIIFDINISKRSENIKKINRFFIQNLPYSYLKYQIGVKTVVLLIQIEKEVAIK
jgi:hypothetical protein